MKKKYLSIVALSVFSFYSMGQQANKITRPHKPAPFSGVVSPIINSTLLEKSNIWTEDFNVTATGVNAYTTSNGIWFGDDIWKHTYTTSNGEFSVPTTSLSTTTGANGAMIFDVDSVNLAVSPNYVNFTGSLTSPEIDLTNESLVNLVFEHDFRFCCQGSLDLSLSITTDNGITWSTPYDLAGSQISNVDYFSTNGNSFIKQVNITNDAAGETIRLKFTWEGVGSFNSHYYWIIDDICLTSALVNDISAQTPQWGSTGAWGLNMPYYQIPTSQVQEINFSAGATNNGLSAQNNVQLNVDVNAGSSFSAQSVGVVLLPGESDVIDLNVPYTPSANVGTHDVSWGITQTEVDEAPIDNALMDFTIDVTNNIYARDAGVEDGGTFNSGYGFESGNIFDVFFPDNLYGIDVTIGAQTEPGSNVRGKLYTIDANGTFVLVDSTQYYSVQAGDIGENITLSLLSAQNGGYYLNADEAYLVTVATNGNNGTSNDLVVGTSGLSAPQSSYFFDATNQTWSDLANTQMIRMNFDNALSIEENSQVNGVSLFPNPTVNQLNVSYNIANSSDITIEIVNVLGQRIESFNEGVKTKGHFIKTINTENYSKGIYYLNIRSNHNNFTQKFIKK